MLGVLDNYDSLVCYDIVFDNYIARSSSSSSWQCLAVSIQGAFKESRLARAWHAAACHPWAPHIAVLQLRATSLRETSDQHHGHHCHHHYHHGHPHDHHLQLHPYVYNG